MTDRCARTSARARLRPLHVGAGLLLAIASSAAAADRQPPAEPGRALVVAVREAPPFALRGPAGAWEGLSVDLWQELADERGWSFQWRELPLAETLDALAAGDVDVAVAALTITPDRERRLDFSHPYYVGGLSLARNGAPGSAWLQTVRGFFSLPFLSAVGALAAVLLAAGTAVWLFERRANPEQFGSGSAVRGLGAGFWWSAVTMTTVGYGDKAPRTLGGRIVALVWMFASLIIIASFTAAIAASVTVNRLGGDFMRGRELQQLVVGAVANSSGEEYLETQGARIRRFPSLEEALAALRRDEVDVVLHDAPMLRYQARVGEGRLEVAPRVLVRDDYGFGLPSGSPLREAINETLLSILHQPVWQDIRRRYLGED